MYLIFRDKFVKYNQIDDVELMDINDLLIENNIYLPLGDESSYDWAGYAYYYCKSLNELDNRTISSFVYIITWIMAGEAINVPPYFNSRMYYKNDLILEDCMKLYDSLDELYDSEIELCKYLFKTIYSYYIEHHEKYLKKTERVNGILTYKDMILFEKLPVESRSDKIKLLLDNYYCKI